MDAWIVGGALRDLALGRPVSEVDLAVSGDAAIVARALEARGYGRPGRTRVPEPAWAARDRIALAAAVLLVVVGALWL